MRHLLNNTTNIDIELLDTVVSYVYEAASSSNAGLIADAQDILSELKSKGEMWRVVDRILDNSAKPSTHFFALQILDEAVSRKWNILSNSDREAIKKFLWNYIIMISANSRHAANSMKASLNKANCTLLHVLRHEWPENWPNFIIDLLALAKSGENNEGTLRNVFDILQLLSDEIYGSENCSMTSREILYKRDALGKVHAPILRLGTETLQKSESPSVTISTLKMVGKYLAWIPTTSVLESGIIHVIGSKYLLNNSTQVIALSCLTEIASKKAISNDEKYIIQSMFRGVMSFFTSLYVLESPFQEIYEHDRDGQADFIYGMVHFLVTIFKYNQEVVENSYDESACAMRYLIKFTAVKNKEVFRICNDYWNHFCSELCSEELFEQHGSRNCNDVTTRKISHYQGVLSELRLVLTQHMAKPEEIIIVEDENGDLLKEYITDGETIDLYNTMRETLVMLTHLDVDDMEKTLVENLKSQTSNVQVTSFGAEQKMFSWGEMNKLCWAIGSISGAMTEAHERSFFITVLRELLEMCASAHGKENKAVIASNIMYVVGQYPRFLRSHSRFLQTVANKLTEFMHETFPGVQDMAVDTFLKLARKCGSTFISGEAEDDALGAPYIESYLANLDQVIEVLPKPLIYTLYEALGAIVSCDERQSDEEYLVRLLFEIIDYSWNNGFDEYQKDKDLLKNSEYLKDRAFILKCMASAGHGVGSKFIHYLVSRLESILATYSHANHILESELRLDTSYRTVDAHTYSLLKLTKRGILQVLNEAFVVTQASEIITEQILPYVLDSILPHFSKTDDCLRDAQFLVLLRSLVENFKSDIRFSVSAIASCAIEPTITMISRNMHDFPDLRVQVFKLVRALTKNCFEPFLQYAKDNAMIIEGILWGVKHTATDISSISLETLFEFIKQVSRSALAESFFMAYFMTIFSEIFVCLTDTMHTADFALHVQIIHALLKIASTAGSVSLDQAQDTKSLNHIRAYLEQQLFNAYPNLKDYQVRNFTEKVCALGVSAHDISIVFQDFIVESKEWGPEKVKCILNSSVQKDFVVDHLSHLDTLSIADSARVQHSQSKLHQLPGFVVDKHHTSYNESKSEEFL